MTGKELAALIQDAVDEGRLTTYKKLEEDRRVSRSTIDREIRDGKYIAVRLKMQWLLIKQE
jgi:hypothetical protein